MAPRLIFTLMNINIDTNLLLSLIVGVFVGSASAYIGSIMVLKRLALVGDALSHVALPGIGIALTFNLNPFLGAFTALAIAIVIIWQIQTRTGLPTEALVGLLFTVSLAIGILITPEPELLEALFGDISKVVALDAVLAMIFSLVIFTVIYRLRNALVLDLISSDLAKSQRINTAKLNLIFLALVAIVVALGVKVVGTLLMGSLVIIPAVASKNLTRNLRSYGVVSACFGAMSAVGGIILANGLQLPPGPMVVLVSAALFIISLFFRSR